MKELDQAKRTYERAHDAITSGCLAVIREGRGVVWEELYYDQSYPNRIETLNRRFEAAAVHHPEIEALRPRLGICRNAAAEVARLKAAPRPERRVSSNAGTYKFPVTPSGTTVFEAGELALIRYGNGTQLIKFVYRLPSRGISVKWNILRLFNRGTQYAHWRESKISSNDSRILGRSHLIIQDPKP